MITVMDGLIFNVLVFVRNRRGLGPVNGMLLFAIIG